MKEPCQWDAASPPEIWLDDPERAHPRVLGWWRTMALALGGSNQSLFLITALFAGQGATPGQGSAAVPLLFIGLLLGCVAAPGWIELVLMSPCRVGGIAAVCTTAFRPYSPILSALAGVCYWWGWVPTCGVTALMAATALRQLGLPFVPVPLLALSIVAVFTVIALGGLRWTAKAALPLALVSASLAFVSMALPIVSGNVRWACAIDYHLGTPFPGWFGTVTSLMAGLYLVGCGAPAFEAASCYVGETRDPAYVVPRAVLGSALMASLYFVALPVIWLGTLGPHALGHDLGLVLGPVFSPLLGDAGKSCALGFLVFNMFQGTLQPLAGASRTLAQLSEDGLAPRMLALRSRTDAPWVATLLTAGSAILFLLIGDPISLIAASSFTYLISICLPSVAVWLLRRDAPDALRPYRAPRGTIGLGLAAACGWGASALLGFEQFGLLTVVIGLLMALSGAGLYTWRKLEDRARRGAALAGGLSMHLKLAGPMLLVLALDAAACIYAVSFMPEPRGGFVVMFEDVFVAVALLTIAIGIVLPGMVAHSANQISVAARHLAMGTVRDLAAAMYALGRGDLDAAHARVDIVTVNVRSGDELGIMADSFNMLQESVKQAAVGLDEARRGLAVARAELIGAREAAVFESLHDALTGLPNRTCFRRHLADALASADDPDAMPCAVLCVDLDGFKVVNESLGHQAGDDLLVSVGERFSALIDHQESAAARDRPVLARLGGDEFTLLMPALDDHNEAIGMATRLMACLAEPFVLGGHDVFTSASIGIAVARAGQSSVMEILRQADMAMHRAKEMGRARAALYDGSMHASATARLRLEGELRRALREDQFVLHYQPIVSLADRRIVGFEALLRWNAPDRGLVFPGDFITTAEHSGLIVPLGLWVFRKACETVRDWGRRLPMTRPPSMSVNISPSQFAHPDLLEDVRRVLLETGVEPSCLRIEITESGTMGNPERAIGVLNGLKALGIKLSLDDFGTGYSSLNYLHRFPLDVLKVDRSFVSGLAEIHESQQIVRTIMGLGKGLGMQVVAEGIETEEQAAYLRELDCDFGQGYLYSRPVTEAQAFTLLELRADDEATELLAARAS